MAPLIVLSSNVLMYVERGNIPRSTRFMIDEPIIRLVIRIFFSVGGFLTLGVEEEGEDAEEEVENEEEDEDEAEEAETANENVSPFHLFILHGFLLNCDDPRKATITTP